MTFAQTKDGKARITLVSGGNLPSKGKKGPNTFVRFYKGKNFIGESKVIKGSTDPEWNEYWDIDSINTDVGVELIFEVYAKGTIGNKLLGEVRLKWRKSVPIRNTTALPLTGKGGATAGGSLTISWEFDERSLVENYALV